MGQDPSPSGASVTDQGDPEQIQREIEETRAQLGDTVEALAHKTDVKAQAKQKLDQTKAWVSEKRDELLGKAKGASPDGAAAAASQLSRTAKRNPLPLAAIGVFVAGLLAGRASRR
jgi:Protein of unknown function (DUF3618)